MAVEIIQKSLIVIAFPHRFKCTGLYFENTYTLSESGHQLTMILGVFILHVTAIREVSFYIWTIGV